MRLSDWIDATTNHRYLSPALSAVKDAASGLGGSVTGGDESVDTESVSAEAWGPTDGPAPAGDTERSPVVKFDAVVGDVVVDAQVQFWMPRGGGAILAAWEIGGQTEHGGVLDREESVLWLGKKPYWSTGGERFTRVDLGGDTSLELWEAFNSLVMRYQKMNISAEYSEPSDTGASSDDAPAPDNRDAGDVVRATVTNRKSTLPAKFQLWCPESTGATYVAWKIGEQSGKCGVLHASGLWLGEEDPFESPSGVHSPFVYLSDSSVEQKLRESASQLRTRAGGREIECDALRDTVVSDHPKSPGQARPDDPFE